jgi:hypothetical protein
VKGKRRRAYICEDCSRLAVEVFDDKQKPLPNAHGQKIGDLEPSVRPTAQGQPR